VEVQAARSLLDKILHAAATQKEKDNTVTTAPAPSSTQWWPKLRSGRILLPYLG